MVQLLWKTVWRFLKKLKTELPYDLAFPLLGIYPKELKIKTTMRYYLTPVRMAIIKKYTNHKCWRGCGEKGASYTVGGNVSWCSHCGKQCGGSSEN